MRALLVNLTLSLSVSVLFAGALEGLARAFEPRRPAADYFPDWRRWEGDFYRFGASPPAWPPAQPTNGDGLRDRHHSVAAQPGLRRLVCLGDSVTYGYGLEAQNAFPQVLERLYASEGGRVEVFNVAAPGWSTRQARIAYRALMRKYAVQRVVLGVCLNDIPELQNNLARTPPWLAGLFTRSALVRRMVNAVGREIGSVRELFEQPQAAVVQAGFARLFDELRALRAELAQDGGTLALAVLPFRFQVQPGAPAPSVQERLRAFAQAEGLPFLDLLPSLAPLGEAAFSDYCHLTPTGTRAVAKALHASTLPDAPPTWPQVLARNGLDVQALERGAPAPPDAGPELRAAAAWAQARAAAAAPQATHRQLLAERLTRLLEDADAGVRCEALRGLEALGPQANPARGRVLALLEDPHEAVRLGSAHVLWAQPSAPGELPVLGRLLAHEDALVAAFAEASLLRAGAAALPTLMARLDDPRAELRARAARSLGRLGPAASPAIRALTQRLADPDPHVRRVSARALGRLGAAASEAVPALERALHDPVAPVSAAAREALARVRGSVP
jgi:lysophospholipase L1-like esterase/HEAT repeat protein